MRTQIQILGGSFVLFGLLAWVLMQQFSVAYIGLILFGVACIFLGFIGTK